MDKGTGYRVVNILKVILSTIVSAIPFLVFCYFFEQKMSSLLFGFFSSIFMAFILEHFYRKLCALVTDSEEEETWGSWFKPKFFGRALLLVVFSVSLKWMAYLILFNLPLGLQKFLPIISFVISFITYFIIYFSYVSFLAYGLDNVSFFEGFARGFAVIYDNIAFFIIMAFVIFGVSCIPVVGYICSLLVFVITEVIKAYMYIDYYETERNEEVYYYDMYV